MICAYIKAQFEKGNQEFKAKKVRLEKLMNQWYSQKMDYFIQVFIPSFSKSIDEITFNS